MAVVTLQQVQAWLEQTKLTLPAFDTELELVARTNVFAKVANQYDVSAWIDAGSTPTIISEVVAMLVAAWTYRRQYSEDSNNDNWYAVWLENQAWSIVDSIVAGTTPVPGGVPIDGSGGPGVPDFYPDDDTEFDGTGSEIKFTMGSRY